MDQSTDDELYRRYRRGNNQAFDALYARYREPIYGYLRKSLPAHRVEELYQDVWLKVIAAAKRYNDAGRFRQWIFTCAHHLIVDEYRRASRATEVELSDIADQDNESCSPLLHNLDQALKELPFDQRQTFYLRHELECSVTEIAEIMDCKPEAAKSRLRYAYNKLRDRLEASDQ